MIQKKDQVKKTNSILLSITASNTQIEMSHYFKEGSTVFLGSQLIARALLLDRAITRFIIGQPHQIWPILKLFSTEQNIFDLPHLTTISISTDFSIQNYFSISV